MVTPFHYNTPLMLLVFYDANTVWRNPQDRYYRDYNSGEQDASIAATTMMYKAEELGVHSVWLRGFDSRTVVDTFGLPDNIIPVMMFAMGYPSERSEFPSDRRASSYFFCSNSQSLTFSSL